jgi:hypothetical protein
MSYYLKNLLNESEKRRILNLHENRKKSEWRGLIMEATQEEAQSFFDKRKTKMKNFPPNGTVIDYDGKGNFAYQITGTDGKPLYLFADGTAKDSVGNTAANRWYGQLSPDEVALDKMATLKPTELQTNASPSTLTSTPSTVGSGPQNMMTGREIKQGRKTLKRELKSAKKQLKKENRKNVQNCLTYFKNWEKDWNQKDEALQVIVKETSPNYKAYATFLSSCCNILTENGKQPALVGLCSTKGVEPETVLGSGPTNPTANNPVSGAPAPGTEVTGAIPPSSSIANTPVGTGMPTQGTTTQGRTTRSREDQEMIDQGLGQ